MINIVDTGTLIKTYLDENDITAAALASISNVSLDTISCILNNKSKLTYEVAEGINKLMPSISIDFIIDYDAKYHSQIGDINDKD